MRGLGGRDCRLSNDIRGHGVYLCGVEILVGLRLTSSRERPRDGHDCVDGCQREYGFLGNHLNPCFGVVELSYVAFGAPECVHIEGFVCQSTMEDAGFTSLFVCDVVDRLALYDEVFNFCECRHDLPEGLLQSWEWIRGRELSLSMRHDVRWS